MSELSGKRDKLKPTEIEAQLERILISDKFLAADQLARFLRFVVTETLAGRQDQIKQYTVAVKALGRPIDFDPTIDAIVRIQAGQLRRALRRYYTTVGARDPIRIDIPKGRYVPDFSSAPQAASSPAAEELQAALPGPTALSGSPSVAVLPFVFRGTDQADLFWASGITDEIIIALTRFPPLTVIGPLDRDAAPGRGSKVREIGQQYGVRFVLDGAIRKRGDTLRVTAKLTDAANGAHLWGQALDYDLENAPIQEVEEDLVGRVVATIADSFGVIPRTLAREARGRRTDCLSNYEAALRFHHHVRTVTEESLREAIEASEKTLQRDPDHELATALLADLLTGPYWLGYVDDTSDLDRAEELGQRALALDPNSQAAHLARAIVHFLRFQRESCLAEIEQVLDLNPNYARCIADSALLLVGLGEWERGLNLMRRAMRLNPHHPGWYHLVPYLDHYRRGEYDLALGSARRFNTPAYFWDPLIRAAALGQLGRREAASKAVGELMALAPEFRRRGRSVIQRMVFLDEHVEMLVEGLRKAGLALGG